MKHYEYVKKSEYMPVKYELIELIKQVQDELRENFTFRYDFIGSSSRNMITYDHSSNQEYDFDVNIEVNDPDNNYCAKELKHMIMNTFDKCISCSNSCIQINALWSSSTQWNFCEDSTRVFTIKVYEYRGIYKIIKYSCDFAIVNNFEENGQKMQEYIRFNKQKNDYFWCMQGKGYMLSNKENWLKKSEYWQEVREIYLEKKNKNMDVYKKSRSLYAETINELYSKYHK